MPYKWVKEDLNNNVYKYYFTTSSSNQRLTWREVLELLTDKDQNFFPDFQLALVDANNKSFPYLWNCSPVSKNGLDKSFEFVVKRERGLENIQPDHSAFQEHIDRSSNPEVTSFLNLGKDGTLVIPMPASGLNFADISRFTKNASLEKQQYFWQEAAKNLTKELKGGKTKWLNTHGTGVHYLHVRIDSSPKYYFFDDYKKPDYTPIKTPQTPLQKVLNNIDKVCLDPSGNVANAELLKKSNFANEQAYIEYINQNPAIQKIEEGNTELSLVNINKTVIKRAIINEIKENPNDWEIKQEGEFEIIKHKNGSKNWKTAFSQQQWKEIETALKNSPNKKQETEKREWYNPLDYPLPWTIAVAFSALLIVITTIFWKRHKRKF